jgi:hypothetical protein
MPELALSSQGPQVGWERDRVRRRIALALVFVGSGLAGAVLVVRLLEAIPRLGGTEGFAGGIWVALADYANRGIIYPPLFDGETFGGTRYMPVPILLHALTSRLTADYLVSGHVLGMAYMAGLLAVLVGVARRSVPIPIALLLASAVLATDVGRLAAIGIRFEALPTVLQLAAVASVGRRGPWSLVLASGLCTMAILTKVTALFAPIALVLWLATRDRRGLVTFASMLLAELGVAALVIELLSSGRFSENLGATLFAAQGTPDLVAGAARLVRLGARDATPIALLVPFVVIGLLLAIHHRQITLVQVGLLAALPVTAVILSEPGSAYNHLLDVTVLVAIAAAEAWRLSQHEPRIPDVVPAVMSTVLGATILAWLTLALPGIWPALSQPRGPGPAILTARLIGAAGPILSEDAAIPVLAHQTPVVLDPFMLVRIGKLDPDSYDSLIHRVEREEFLWVVSLQALDAPEARDLYRERRFGAGVHDALLHHYRLSRRIGTYWLYRPRAGP